MSQTYSRELKEQVAKKVQDTHNATLGAAASTQSEYGATVGSRGAATGGGQSRRLTLAEENAPLKRFVIDRDGEIMALKDALRKKGSRP